MIKRRPPTHIMTIKIPLHVDASTVIAGEYEDAFRGAIATVLAMHTLADRGYLCDDPIVELHNV